MKLNRLEFLFKLTAGITALSSANKLLANNKKKNFLIKKVTVVGGGIAGLYSAYLLKNSGYDVTIIEAKNRL